MSIFSTVSASFFSDFSTEERLEAAKRNTNSFPPFQKCCSFETFLTPKAPPPLCTFRCSRSLSTTCWSSWSKLSLWAGFLSSRRWWKCALSLSRRVLPPEGSWAPPYRLRKPPGRNPQNVFYRAVSTPAWFRWTTRKFWSPTFLTLGSR